jgi:hypothetical protein
LDGSEWRQFDARDLSILPHQVPHIGSKIADLNNISHRYRLVIFLFFFVPETLEFLLLHMPARSHVKLLLHLQII